MRCDGNIFEISVHQNRTKTNDDLTPVWHLRTNFNAVWIKAQYFLIRKRHLNMSFAKWLLWTNLYILRYTLSPKSYPRPCITKMTSSNGNIFRVTGPLCGEFTGHRWIPLTTDSDAELRCFFLICAWINVWVNNRKAGDLRRHRAHYNVTVMLRRTDTVTIDRGNG